jgi:ubiquinone/menaquinone biosynthesis C-methylase UbiE
MKSSMFRQVTVLLLSIALGTSLCAAAKPSGRDAWQQPARVVADLGLTAGSRVADIGCGRGYLTFRLAKAVGKEGKVFATEISEKSLKSVADRAKNDKLSHVEPVLSAPTDTKLEPACVDAAIICNVLHHVPKDQRPALAKSIAKAIKPGGFFYICDWRVDAKIQYDKGRRIPRTELVKLATDAGLPLDAEYHYLVHQVFLRFRKPPKTN